MITSLLGEPQMIIVAADQTGLTSGLERWLQHGRWDPDSAGDGAELGRSPDLVRM